jgi:hypothetical protein
MEFKAYTDCLLSAFVHHTRQSDVVKRKKEIIGGVGEFYNIAPDTILYIGFSPAILVEQAAKIYVTEVSENVLAYLTEQKINVTHIPKDKLVDYKKQFQVVVALDEYFTFANTDDGQKLSVAEICNLASEYLITTCKDYKNQNFKDREFSVPALIRNSGKNQIFLEFHDYDLQDRLSWKTTVHEVLGNKLTVAGPFARRAMFFKQLAKFAYDAGAVNFTVHKNLMYKSLIKKNYEHVISIQFDSEYGS